jgi:hypothetical protein
MAAGRRGRTRLLPRRLRRAGGGWPRPHRGLTITNDGNLDNRTDIAAVRSEAAQLWGRPAVVEAVTVSPLPPTRRK